MVIVGMDPSFNALSTSILNVETHKVYLQTISESLGDNIGFDKVFMVSRKLRDAQLKYIDKLISDKCIDTIDKLFSEMPPPAASFSSGLFALDNLVISSMYDTYNIGEVYVIPSSYVATIHGTNKYNKSDSTKLAKYFINEVLGDKIEVIIQDYVSEKGRVMKGKLNNDKAESFLFLLRAIVKYDIYGLSKVITSEMSGFIHEPEKLVS